ncbi:unnamed protein product [Adineta ricciae]|uniref:Uncharacterized protein n=1 Tax=Adineta ricciae TaxID=249248 RepID=A0A816DGY3_ADIRI|nr:unnamed protein product [Adineta ricciae]
MVDSNDNVGIIILGNNNSEKSFLGNVILKRELLQHKYQELSFLGQSYIVYNIPSLIEAEQERIDLNKREIYTFFQQHPRSIVLFVFGINNESIRHEDIVAFTVLNQELLLMMKIRNNRWTMKIE